MKSTKNEGWGLRTKNESKALEEVAGKPLPTIFAVTFVENKGANMTIVLPEYKEDENELSNTELEHVAGGKWTTGPVRGGFLEDKTSKNLR